MNEESPTKRGSILESKICVIPKVNNVFLYIFKFMSVGK
jgi:hypothetical protein